MHSHAVPVPAQRNSSPLARSLVLLPHHSPPDVVRLLRGVSAFQKKQAEEKKALAALKSKITDKGFVKTKVGK